MKIKYTAQCTVISHCTQMIQLGTNPGSLCQGLQTGQLRQQR